MAQIYDHQKLESKWRQIWEDSKTYSTPTNIDPKNKMYVLPQLPYPSGSGLHVGHAEGYTACDIYARYQRMIGKDVLQAIGWDAFGLPAENYAIKTNVHPRINTDKAIDNFREQIKSLGISVDWDREVGSHNPDYYKWTQWFFLLMYKRGLAYRKKQAVNWCEHDKTVLANEQVEDGKCERCGNDVVQKEMEQWFFKITEYADRLIDDLDKVDWPAETIKRQREWIGRSEGAQINFELKQKSRAEEDGKGDKSQLDSLKVFTTRPDTIFGVTFMVVAPEHEILSNIDQLQLGNPDEVRAYIEQASHKTELERQQQKHKTGVELEGLMAVNPVNGEQIPIYVADYVLAGYGTGAIMAVPAHDERDFEFAQERDINVRQVVELDDENGVEQQLPILAKSGGRIVNSDFLNGLDVDHAIAAAIAWLEQHGHGSKETTYKLRDWSISRQRFWGAPIPMVYDPDGNLHPVDESDLPVILPDDVDFKPTGQSPLTYSEKFQEGVEEKYGKGWRREVDTLDTFMCSSWYYFRYIDPHNDDAFASGDALKNWMPVDFYIGGTEHVNGHLLYSRFFTKVLFDAGYIDFDEPFLLHRHQGIILGPDGRKMSKRWGNVVNPTDVVAEYGADTARMYEMFMGPLEQDKAWNDSAVQGVRRFLNRVYNFADKVDQNAKDSDHIEITINKLIVKVQNDIESLSYNTAIAEFMKVLKIFEDEPQSVSLDTWKKYIKLMAPFAPFLMDELWSKYGTSSVHLESWPRVDDSALQEEKVEVAVQINGKVRDTVMLPSGVGQKEAGEAAQGSRIVQKHLQEAEIVKVIYVPDRILNFVVKS